MSREWTSGASSGRIVRYEAGWPAASIAVAVPESRLAAKVQASIVHALEDVRTRFNTLAD